MRTFVLLMLVAIVVALGLTMAPTTHSSRYGTALGTSVAFAQDDGDPIPLPPRPRPGGDPACSRVCLSTAGGTRYCAFATGDRIGCKSIVNNNCIYTLCPLWARRRQGPGTVTPEAGNGPRPRAGAFLASVRQCTFGLAAAFPQISTSRRSRPHPSR
jgi:hypothetical protein